MKRRVKFVFEIEPSVLEKSQMFVEFDDEQIATKIADERAKIEALDASDDEKSKLIELSLPLVEKRIVEETIEAAFLVVRRRGAIAIREWLGKARRA